MTTNDAPPQASGVEAVARIIDPYAFKSWQSSYDYEMKLTGDAVEATKFADWSAGKRIVEARDKASDIIAALSPSTGGADGSAVAITARYTNWRGETAERTFIPHRVFFGSTEWHPEPQVLIEATDCEKGELRTFAAAGFAHPAPATDGFKTFRPGDRVTKTKGSSWTGRVVGFYSTKLTLEGYAVESDTETGSVQIYPVAALANAKGGA